MQELSSQVFPKHRPLTVQMRYMRQNIKKPRTMRVRAFIEWMLQLNNCLEHFPPDFEREQVLPEEEVLDCILNAMPPKWQQTLLTNGYDTIDSSLDDLSKMLKLQEAAKDAFGHGQKENAADANRSQQRGKSNNPKWGCNPVVDNNRSNKKKKHTNSNEKSKKWCELHHVVSHNTGNCHVVLDQVKKMRGMWDTKRLSSHTNNKNAWTNRKLMYDKKKNESNHIKELSDEDEEPTQSKNGSNNNKKQSAQLKKHAHANNSSNNSSETTVSDYLSNYAFSKLGKSRKCRKAKHVSTEAIALVCGSTKTNKPAGLRVLFDMSTTRTIVLDSSIIT